MSLDPRDGVREIADDLMLPEPDDGPPLAPEASEVPRIAPPVALDLPLPERGKTLAPCWESIAVPKVAIDEHDDASRGEDEIWATRQRPHVLAVPEATRVECGSDREFDIGARRPDALHAAAALLGGEGIDHRQRSDV